jgi:hypothetical protein
MNELMSGRWRENTVGEECRGRLSLNSSRCWCCGSPRTGKEQTAETTAPPTSGR